MCRSVLCVGLTRPKHACTRIDEEDEEEGALPDQEAVCAAFRTLQAVVALALGTLQVCFIIYIYVCVFHLWYVHEVWVPVCL